MDDDLLDALISNVLIEIEKFDAEHEKYGLWHFQTTFADTQNTKQ